MEALRCPWRDSKGQQCSGTLQLHATYSTDMAYYNGPDTNDITEYYVCNACCKGFQRRFKWGKWVDPNVSKKDPSPFTPLVTRFAQNIARSINRECGTQLVAKEDHILCSEVDWGKIRGLHFFDPVTSLSLLEQGQLGSMWEISIRMDESWKLESRNSSPENAKNAVVAALKNFHKSYEEKGE